MPIAPGTRLGEYEILSSLGAGGMGEVYRALDPKLEREVAIKVLPEGFAADPERMARFEREAKVLASLSHPNIARLYGYHSASPVARELESDGQAGAEVTERPASRPTQFLVMELVEGETLAERIARGPIPLDEALPLFLQIAEGLEAAHELGIVHRDLKPANVKVVEEGPGAPDRVSILDFGLAKAVAPEALSSSGAPSAAPAESPTLTYMATMRGEILGTAAYMSPEQARGKAVDRRTDVWAFGACLYEALTGSPAFSGETPTDIIAQVVTKEPDLDALPAGTPVSVRRLLARCLERDPRRRLRDIGEAWVVLEGVSAGGTAEDRTGDEEARRDVEARSARWTARLGWLVAAALAAALGLSVLLRAPTAAPEPGLRRFAIDLGPSSPIPVMEVQTMVALSPAGDSLAVSLSRSGLPQLYLRRFDQLELEPIEGTDFAYAPFFSPDGEWIGFHDPGTRTLKKVPVAGGPVQTLCDAYPPLGGAWLEDGTIVFTRQVDQAPGLSAIDAKGGRPRELTRPEGGEVHVFPSALPGGAAVLFTRGVPAPEGQKSSLAVLDLESGDIHDILEDGSQPVYASEVGHVLFFRQGAIWGVPFDPDTRSVNGEPVLLQTGVSGGLAYSPWTVSPGGLLVFAPPFEGASGGAMRLVWRDREGRGDPLDVDAGSFVMPRISPDGRRLAVLVGEPRLTRLDVWIYDLGGRPPIKVTSGKIAASPIWTPDGRGITYLSGRTGQVLTVPSDGSSSEKEELGVPLGGPGGPQAWTPDGEELLFGVSGGQGGEGAHTIVVGRDGRTRRLIESESHITNVELSPDGRWIAYASNATGNFEVYVKPYSGVGPQHRVSVDGTTGSIRWARDGGEIYFASGESLMAASFEPGPEPEIGLPVRLFDGVFPQGFDVAPDGRFLVVEPANAQEAYTARLVLVDGLRARLNAVGGGG